MTFPFCHIKRSYHHHVIYEGWYGSRSLTEMVFVKFLVCEAAALLPSLRLEGFCAKSAPGSAVILQLTCLHGLLTCLHGLLMCLHRLLMCMHELFMCFHGLLMCLHGLLMCVHGLLMRLHELLMCHVSAQVAHVSARVAHVCARVAHVSAQAVLAHCSTH